MLDRLRQYAPHLIASFAAIIFLDSLRYKFINAPETQQIFGLLNNWATFFPNHEQREAETGPAALASLGA